MELHNYDVLYLLALRKMSLWYLNKFQKGHEQGALVDLDKVLLNAPKAWKSKQPLVFKRHSN